MYLLRNEVVSNSVTSWLCGLGDVNSLSRPWYFCLWNDGIELDQGLKSDDWWLWPKTVFLFFVFVFVCLFVWEKHTLPHSHRPITAFQADPFVHVIPSIPEAFENCHPTVLGMTCMIPFSSEILILKFHASACIKLITGNFYLHWLLSVFLLVLSTW